MKVFIVSPIGATGQHNAVNSFAYRNSGFKCHKLGAPVWMEYDKEQGMRQLVRIVATDETGYVWEDELEELCLMCNMVQWACECDE